MKVEMIQWNFNKDWQRLMSRTLSIETIPIGFQCDAIERSSMK
jgi:hypothetical protein